MKLVLSDKPVSLAQLRKVWEQPCKVELSNALRTKVLKARKFVDQLIEKGGKAYGVNTGFGKLATVGIDPDNLRVLQKNLVRSHSAGVGKPLSDQLVRLTMVLKIVALSRGHSGVRPDLIDLLCKFLDLEIYPITPSQGSVGASGDLAPLAHIALALIGEGEVSLDGKVCSTLEALNQFQIAPVELKPKEGLALLNGTQVSTALAIAALFRFEHVFAASIVSGALSTDATKSSDGPFESRIHEVRGHQGQKLIGSLLARLLKGSEIRASHLDCNRVQDPYSIRCQPQVSGACLDTTLHVAKVLEVEANAVSDNPLVFPDDGEILSNGNFHAEPVSLVADYLALAIAEIGSMSERRVALLMDGNLSNLPHFLVEGSGLKSGFMLAQVTAAALVSENKVFAHPASVDSIPTSANQEDHVSMATFAAARLHNMLDNIDRIVAIELLAATQGIEFHRSLSTSQELQEAIRRVRLKSPPYNEDRSLSADIEAIASLIDNGEFSTFSKEVFPTFN